jgi:hypothetical protein
MAKATATITTNWISFIGNKVLGFYTFTVSSYATDGIDVSASKLRLSAIDLVVPVIGTQVANGPVAFWYDPTNEVLHALKASNSETDAATAFTVFVLVIGN